MRDLSPISRAQRQEAAGSRDVTVMSEAESDTVCWRNNVVIDGGCNNATFLGERILHCLISYRQDFLLPVIQDYVDSSCSGLPWCFLIVSRM